MQETREEEPSTLQRIEEVRNTARHGQAGVGGPKSILQRHKDRGSACKE